jgi:hypothetical protein
LRLAEDFMSSNANIKQQGRNGKTRKLEREAGQKFVLLVDSGRKKDALIYYRGLDIDLQEYIKDNHNNYLMTARCQC